MHLLPYSVHEGGMFKHRLVVSGDEFDQSGGRHYVSVEQRSSVIQRRLGADLYHDKPYTHSY